MKEFETFRTQEMAKAWGEWIKGKESKKGNKVSYRVERLHTPGGSYRYKVWGPGTQYDFWICYFKRPPVPKW